MTRRGFTGAAVPTRQVGGNRVRILTDEEKAEILARRRDGQSQRAIAKAMHMRADKVNPVLREAGLIRVDSPTDKWCSICYETKPFAEFGKSSRGDGLKGQCRECRAQEAHERQQRYRQMALEALGGHCVRCGIVDFRVLVIDHCNGGGTKDRREHREQVAYYRRVLANLWLFQVLCWNCNHLKRLEMGEHRGRRDS